MAANIIFIVLSLILNCPSLKLTIAIYKGLPIGRPLPYIRDSLVKYVRFKYKSISKNTRYRNGKLYTK